jgi:hypothetical protein
MNLDARVPGGRVDRAILRLLLERRNADALNVTALTDALPAAALEEVISATDRLKAHGVLEMRAGCVELSTCARHMAELGLIVV